MPGIARMIVETYDAFVKGQCPVSAAKLIELEPGFSVFASSALEARFVHKEIFLGRC
jgi:hypothetical protein